MGGITLKISIQLALLLGNAQLVIGFGEMVHADIHIAGSGKLFDALLQNSQLLFRTGHVRFIDATLRFKQLGHMRIIKQRNPIRTDLDNALQGGGKTFFALQWQAVNQIGADGFEAAVAGTL